jgi:TolB protein
LTPRFSPANQQIAFMQYTGDQPSVFLMNMETGQSRAGKATFPV